MKIILNICCVLVAVLLALFAYSICRIVGEEEESDGTR